MATTIIQQPHYTQVPVGSEIIFTVENNSIVATEKKVKFIAEVHIGSQFQSNLSNNDDVIGVFKTTPNNAGVGIFDLSAVVENYVRADNLARPSTNGVTGSEYKGTLTTESTPHPMHLIDMYSGNLNTMKYLAIRFKIEYLGATDSSGQQDDDTVRIAAGESQNSDSWRIFNGYLKYTDKLRLVGDNFGYFFGKFNMDNNEDKFLTNAPLTQYANIDDYGTFPMFEQNQELGSILFTYYDNTDSVLDTDSVPKNYTTGAYNVGSIGNIQFQILFFGCFPANLRGWSPNFQTLVSNDTISYYTIQAKDSGGSSISDEYTINVNCPDLKGYESVRLTWLNQWGGWDYYTFTKKSSISIKTKGSTYLQQSGTWNEGVYKINGYKGGTKAFRVNATETIKMNTDFVSEAEGVWFEELINSPEVYILNGFQDDFADPLLNTYVTPVRLKTSSYTKKTRANDKLMQYTFEVEKAKILRTQSI